MFHWNHLWAVMVPSTTLITRNVFLLRNREKMRSLISEGLGKEAGLLSDLIKTKWQKDSGLFHFALRCLCTHSVCRITSVVLDTDREEFTLDLSVWEEEEEEGRPYPLASCESVWTCSCTSLWACSHSGVRKRRGGAGSKQTCGIRLWET